MYENVHSFLGYFLVTHNKFQVPEEQPGIVFMAYGLFFFLTHLFIWLHQVLADARGI